MNDRDRLAEAAKSCGFTYSAYLNAEKITLREEVREMCRTGKCGKYGKNWSCPPHCGTLSACREELSRRNRGILLQTVGEVEDSFDIEAMKETERLHKENLRRFCEFLSKEKREILVLGTGCCSICADCTCPDTPCRFPEKQVSSLEAYGVLVTELCKENDMAYYYGSNKISYTAACLWRED